MAGRCSVPGDVYACRARRGVCANFGRNRTFHCGITGPLFILSAAAMALVEWSRWRIDGEIIWGVTLVAVGLTLVTEWQVVGEPRRESSDCCAAPSPSPK